MPFTFSHPGIVLPLNKLKIFSLTGLVMGSLIPDIDHYVQFKSTNAYAHTWTALFSYDLVFAILFTFIYHNIVRNPFIDNSPFWLRARIIQYKNFNWNACFKKRWLIIIISILIGETSHLLLDAIAHENGVFAMQFPYLISTHHYAGINVEGWMIIQIITSALGLLIVFYSIWQLPYDKKIKAGSSSSIYWIIVGGITLIFFLFGITYRSTHRIEDFVIPPITGFLFSLILTPVVLKYTLIP